jgi:hypothetical protein
VAGNHLTRTTSALRNGQRWAARSAMSSPCRCAAAINTVFGGSGSDGNHNAPPHDYSAGSNTLFGGSGSDSTWSAGSGNTDSQQGGIGKDQSFSADSGPNHPLVGGTNTGDTLPRAAPIRRRRSEADPMITCTASKVAIRSTLAAVDRAKDMARRCKAAARLTRSILARRAATP